MSLQRGSLVDLRSVAMYIQWNSLEEKKWKRDDPGKGEMTEFFLLLFPFLPWSRRYIQVNTKTRVEQKTKLTSLTVAPQLDFTQGC